MKTNIAHYQILEVLGRGGMGIVYKARDLDLQRFVALKVLSRKYSANLKSRERFHREARLTSSVQHPNICTIHEFGQTEEGELFITMDYYDGKSLREIISEGIPSLDTILDYGIQICNGLSKAHEKRIIHRDIKPGNILVTDDGLVKILDFGLAKLVDLPDSSGTGKVFGTLSYISPEQAQGLRIDHLSDIWSFGVVLYEMTTGMLPFTHEYEAAIIYSILDKSPIPPSDIQWDLPDELEALIYKCLKKNKNERIAQIKEVGDELTRIRRRLFRNIPQQFYREISKDKYSAERRPVTLVVTELFGLSKEVDEQSEQEINKIRSRCQEILIHTARKHGGLFIEKNDLVFTFVFGLPESIEKSPEKAVSSCIEMLERIQNLSLKGFDKYELNLRIGINTGVIFVDKTFINDREEYFISGDVWKVARYLHKMSKPGQILTGFLTYRNTKEIYGYRLVRLPITEEIPGDTRVYSLQTILTKDNKKETFSGQGFTSKMIGRENETRRMAYYLLRLINGEGYIINLIADAGLGKSRLVAEVLKMDVLKGVKVLHGKGMSTGQNLSFHPIIEIIKDLMDISEHDSDSEQYNKLKNCTDKHCLDDASEVVPCIAIILGLKIGDENISKMEEVEGEGLERLILRNLSILLSGYARYKPILIILEDLHWADQSSLKMLRSLYRLVENSPVLFINVMRPNYEQTGERMRETIRDRYEKYYLEIQLNPLSEFESVRLMEELTGNLSIPPNFSTLVCSRSEGNPFFIEEIINSLFDEGVIAIEGKNLSIKDASKTSIVPENIMEVLMTRIDKLDAEICNLVKLASVIGRNFFLKILQEVSGKVIDVTEGLQFLESIDMVKRQKRMEEVEYYFKHALTHQAVYNSIIPEQQREMHLKVAIAIENIFENRIQEFYGMLAWHFGKAGKTNKVEKYLLSAGKQALRSSASAEALYYFREAHRIYSHERNNNIDMKMRIYKYIADAHFNTGHLIESADYFKKVLIYNRKFVLGGPMIIYSRAITGLIIFLFKIQFPALMERKIPGEREIELKDLILKRIEALSITESMTFVLETLAYLPWLIRYRFNDPAIINIIVSLFSFGGISFSVSRKILNYYRVRLMEENILKLLTAESLFNLLSGKWKNCDYREEAIRNGLHTGDFFNLISYLGMEIHRYLELGEFQTAAKLHDQLSEISENYDYGYGKLASYTHGALYSYKNRHLDLVVEKCNEGIVYVTKYMGNEPGLLMLYSLKIKALVLKDKLEAALHTLKEAESFRRKEQLVPYFHSYFLTSYLMYELAKLEKLLYSEKKEEFRAVRNECKRVGMQAEKLVKKVAYERIEVGRLMGLFYWLCGKQRKAVRKWAGVIRKAKNMGAKLELVYTMKEVNKRFQEPESHYDKIKGESIADLQKKTDLLLYNMKRARYEKI